jgi:glyoxylase-like metal-dependent hydrolase (beta-lactamase superfamily II)
MDPLAAHDIGQITADNPGPFTLRGTNTWLVGRDPCFLIDPGPPLAAHRERVLSDARDRGGIGGIAVTHDHADHTGGLPELRAAAGDPPVAATRHPADVRLADGDTFGPLTVVATPGHAPDHVALLAGRVLFAGDTVLGTGSVFVGGGDGSMGAYLDSLRRLRALDLDVILPGHGPAVWDPHAKLDEYLAHRLERERRVLEAIEAGLETRDEVLDRAWSDVDLEAGPYLRMAAGLTLDAHLEKLAAEGRLTRTLR